MNYGVAPFKCFIFIIQHTQRLAEAVAGEDIHSRGQRLHCEIDWFLRSMVVS